MNDSRTSEWNEFTRTWCLINRFHSQRIWNLFIHSRWLVHNPKTSYGETEYLARCPEEWNTTDEQEDVWVNRLRSSPDTLRITCYASNISINFQPIFNGLSISVEKAGFGMISKTRRGFAYILVRNLFFALLGIIRLCGGIYRSRSAGFFYWLQRWYRSCRTYAEGS